MSNYPPGVTGNEYEIAGGVETELTITASCENTECAEYGADVDDQEVLAEAYGGTVTYDWDCPVCGTTSSYERDESEWDDRDYDDWVDHGRP
jgi:hypothetical protein